MPKKNISTLVLMLSSSIFVALIVCLFLVFYFGFPGTYRVHQLLISPSNFEKMQFTDHKGRLLRFTLSRIEFVFVEKNGMGRHAVNRSSYAQFYQLVKNKRSLSKVTSGMMNDFGQSVPSTLTIFAIPRDNQEGERIFQQVEFLGDLFRILLREESSRGVLTDRWVYFHFPDIEEKVKQML